MTTPRRRSRAGELVVEGMGRRGSGREQAVGVGIDRRSLIPGHGPRRLPVARRPSPVETKQKG